MKTIIVIEFWSPRGRRYQKTNSNLQSHYRGTGQTYIRDSEMKTKLFCKNTRIRNRNSNGPFQYDLIYLAGIRKNGSLI